MKHRIRKKVFRYISGRVWIKSNVYLTEEQAANIFKIVKANMHIAYSYYTYQIARSIAYSLGKNSYMVEIYSNRIRFLVKIFFEYEE